MKSIEKKLAKFIKGKGPKVSNEALCSYAVNDANELVDILFRVVNNELDEVTGLDSLKRSRELLNALTIVISNVECTNRKIVIRKIRKLEEKIERIKIENKHKFIDMNNAYNELEQTEKEIERIAEETIKTNPKQYDLINSIIDQKDIRILEYVFDTFPTIVNSKDKEENCLFQNIIIKYIAKLKEDDEEEIAYYGSIVSLIISQKKLKIKESDRIKCLKILQTEKDKLSIGKKKQKKNNAKIQTIENLIEILQSIEEKEVEVDTIASRYNISINFNEELIEQAKLTRKSKEGKITDREEINDYIITIDGEDATEIDDALSCKKLPNGNYLLGVHIASVLGYFPYESDMIQEAINRNRSIYLPYKYQQKEDDFNRTIPIFPYDFSAKTASLLPNEKKLARSYIFEIDKKGNIVNERFIKSIITSKNKLTYDDVDEVIKRGTNNEQLKTLVNNLKEVTEILDNKYKSDDKTTEIYEQVKENIDDFSDIRVKKVGAAKIVYQAMMLTGARVAEFFAKNNYPLVYRTHEVDQKTIEEIKNMIDNLNKTYGGEQFQKISQWISGICSTGKYSLSGPHQGMGLKHYCHCTSNIRRAADILVEHALEVCYDKEPTTEELEELEKELETKIPLINDKNDKINWFVKDYKKTYRKRR